MPLFNEGNPGEIRDPDTGSRHLWGFLRGGTHPIESGSAPGSIFPVPFLQTDPWRENSNPRFVLQVVFFQESHLFANFDPGSRQRWVGIHVGPPYSCPQDLVV